MSPFAIVGYAAAAVVGIAWLVISFSRPGRGRTLIEWIAATGIYVALTSLFSYLVWRAWREESTVALVGFGFLLLIFASGTCVSLVQIVAARRGSRRSQSSATN